MDDTERLRFNIEQQAKVNKLIDEAYGKGFTKGARQSQTEIEKLKHEIERLKLPFWRR